MKIRGQVDLESCQTNKGIQLNEKWWLGLTIIRSFSQPQLPLYIGGEAEGFFRVVQVQIIGPRWAFPILIQVSYNNSIFLIRASSIFWAFKSSSPRAFCTNYEPGVFVRHAT
jgi:hypothetical protein